MRLQPAPQPQLSGTPTAAALNTLPSPALAPNQPKFPHRLLGTKPAGRRQELWSSAADPPHPPRLPPVA